MAAVSHDLRNISLNIICGVINDGKFVNILLKDCFDADKSLERSEKAFISRLSNGTVERLIYIDYVLAQFIKTPLKRVRPVVLNILRMSVFQLMFMDSVPDNAVCNEAVKLAKKRGFGSLSGFINGVLRNAARRKDSIILPDKEKYPERYLSVKYSMPEWLVRHYLEICDNETAERIFKWYMECDGLTVRCNTSKADICEIIKLLEEDGVSVKRNPYFKEALELGNTGPVTGLRAFNMGYIQVQDTASMLPGFLIPIRSGDDIIDVCAAPGGKSLHAADRLNGTGSVTACDVSEEKVLKINENIKRCGFGNMTAVVQDALVKNDDFVESADIVIADLPCSGLGIIGKKPDIKYNITKASIEELSRLQRDILSAVWEYVKPAGYLVYSTCTVTKEENHENYNWILEKLPFEPVSFYDSLPEGLRCETAKKGYIQLLPGESGCDGFFVALFKRKQKEN